jgi:hypothetical protein
MSQALPGRWFHAMAPLTTIKRVLFTITLQLPWGGIAQRVLQKYLKVKENETGEER